MTVLLVLLVVIVLEVGAALVLARRPRQPQRMADVLSADTEIAALRAAVNDLTQATVQVNATVDRIAKKRRKAKP